MPPVTTIAFDFGGVLVRPINKEHLCHMAATAGADLEQFVSALWRSRNDFDAGVLDAQAYWHSVLTAAGSLEAGSRQGRTDNETIAELMRLDALGWSAVRPAMVSWIAALTRAGYRRLIISNMAAESYDLIIRNSILLPLFERVVLSGWIGINKPDPRIFEAAAREMNVDPSQILFIDDLAHNVEGARAAGLQALQFQDPETFAVELHTRFPDIPITGLICTSTTKGS